MAGAHNIPPNMKCALPILCWISAILVLVAADGCGSNPNVEGARLDLRAKNYQRALTNVNKAIENEPTNSEAHLLKGDILLEMLPDVIDSHDRTAHVGELAGAYAQAVMLDPEHRLYVEMQRISLYSGEFGLAMEAYRDADQLGGRERANRFTIAARHFRNASMIIPDSVSALINEANAYYSAGEGQLAADAYEAAIALEHTDRNLFVYLARTYELMATEFADPEVQPGYYRQMVRTLTVARQHYQDDAEIRKLLLNAYAMSEMMEDALPFFEEIYPLEQDNPIYLYNYGTLLMRQQDYERAIPLLSRAVELDSSYVNAHFNLGAAHVNRGVKIDERYQAVEDSLYGGGRKLAPRETDHLEARKTSLEQLKAKYFAQAIIHLEFARHLLESELSDISGVCHALYLAYAKTNQRSRAEEANICAKQGGY